MRSKNENKLIEIAEYVEWFFDEYEESPSLRDIAKACAMSVPTVCRYVAELDKRGKLSYDGKRFTSDKIDKIKQKGSRVALVGTIACGTPMYAEENIEEYFSLPESLIGKGRFYLLRAKGDSMIDVGINEGDLVLIKEQNTAVNGQIVVALCEDSEATLKRFYKEDYGVRLHPENESMEDIVVDNCAIQGIAVKVLKDLS